MVRFRDFTKLPVGYSIFDSTTRECPRCGRTGLLEVTDGKNFYLHSETSGYADNGTPVVQWDMCNPD
jgi:hypothetical protein